MRPVRVLFLVCCLIAFAAIALPAIAAPGATITSIEFDEATCTITLAFTVEDEGIYYAMIYDDNVLVTGTGDFVPAGGSVVVVFGVGPEGGFISGIGVYIRDVLGLSLNTFDFVDPFIYDEGGCGGSGSTWTTDSFTVTAPPDEPEDTADQQEFTEAVPPCPNPLPDGFAVRSIPAGALAYFEPNEEAYTGFNLPPGTWYTSAAEDGFVEVWIACQATNIFIPAANVVG